MSDYTNLFPFEKIPMGSKIVIYGAGVMGYEYLTQMLMTHYAEVVAFIDREYEKYTGSTPPVYPVDRLKSLQFDFIVLAFQANSYEKQILKLLEQEGINEQRVVRVFSRKKPMLPSKMVEKVNKQTEYAFAGNKISIAVKLSSSLGDNICRKKVIEAFVRIVPDCRIDIYSPVAKSMLQPLYDDCANVANFIEDGGRLYIQNMDAYHVAVTIANFLRVDCEKIDTIKHVHPEFYQRMHLLIQRCKEYHVDFSVPVFTYFAKAIKRGKNCYSVYEYDGVFDIPDKDAHLILNEEYRTNFENLNLGIYITLNYGNAVTMSRERQIAKQWPAERFEQLIRMLHERYPNVTIVQVSGKDAVKLAGVDQYILGEKFELVMHILKNSLLHIDVEGGLVHLATQLGTKCVVLFGPTMEAYFGYEQNINIKAGNCHDCYGMCMDINQCARDMEEPECMYSITPEMVMGRIGEWLRDISFISD